MRCGWVDHPHRLYPPRNVGGYNGKGKGLIAMEIVTDFEFAERGVRGKYHQLYKDFLALPPGTAVKFTAGDDFDVEPVKFATSLRTGLWNKGYRSKVAVRDNEVFAVITGPKADKSNPKEGV